MGGKFQPPPIQGQKLLLEDGTPTHAFRRWLELIPPAITSPANSGDVPALITSQGIPGQMATDGNNLYVCITSNRWKVVALVDF